MIAAFEEQSEIQIFPFTSAVIFHETSR